MYSKDLIMKRLTASLLMLLAWMVPALACTSVIISGKVRADGKPVMFKHRDTSHLTNDIQWFQDHEYGNVRPQGG